MGIIARFLRPIIIGAALAGAALPNAIRADQLYTVNGSDHYRVGDSQLRNDVSYSGTERLTIVRAGKTIRLKAAVRYARADRSGSTPEKASFEALILASGEQRDEHNADPDYLTVLNQPFAAKLDPGTLRDLSRLNARVPFGFPSPMTGGTLHGFLRRSPPAIVAGRRVLSVVFEATGPTKGPLPDHPTISMSGIIQMRGLAHYRLDDGLLLALDATLTISGNVANGGTTTPVKIVYRRIIRAATPTQVEAARDLGLP